MTGIAIYMEGGGDGHAGKALLRQGMDAFLVSLKDVARRRGWRWKLVTCGSRNETVDAFLHADDSGHRHVFLLVDAEEAVTSPARLHLMSRDGWSLDEVLDDNIQLMVQVMETWIVADPVALAGYYGTRFRPNALPVSRTLEQVPKGDIMKALRDASADTGKGRYHKIRHASDLLGRLDPQAVRKRCPSCRRLFDIVGAVLAV